MKIWVKEGVLNGMEKIGKGRMEGKNMGLGEGGRMSDGREEIGKGRMEGKNIGVGEGGREGWEGGDQ